MRLKYEAALRRRYQRSSKADRREARLAEIEAKQWLKEIGRACD
jgi:hypothetical protein